MLKVSYVLSCNLYSVGIQKQSVFIYFGLNVIAPRYSKFYDTFAKKSS